MTTYIFCKKLIETGKTDGMKEKLDVFLLNDRITQEQYTELIGLIG